MESSLEFQPFVFLSVLVVHKQIHLQGHAWRCYISSSIYKNSNILLFKDKWIFSFTQRDFKQCDATYWILMKVQTFICGVFSFSRNRFASSLCNELAQTFCQKMINNSNLNCYTLLRFIDIINLEWAVKILGMKIMYIGFP